MSRDFYAFLSQYSPEAAVPNWQGAVLNRVEVQTEKAAWRFYITISREPVPRPVIEETIQALRKAWPFLEDIDFNLQTLELENILHTIRDKHRAEIEALFPSAEVFHSVKWRVENNRLDLLAGRAELFDIIMKGQACPRLSAWLWEQYRLRVVVRARCEEAPEQGNQGAVFIPAREPNLLDEKVKTRKKKGGKRQNYADLLTGSPPMAYAELEDGLRNAVVEGEVWEKNTTPMRDGRILAAYYISDYKDSLIVKAFYDRAGDDQINPGEYIRVWGSVRYDPNLREITLVMDGFEKRPKPMRTDDEENKRVELHAHTKMSAMDGLAEVHELVERAARWGHSAIAITDHGCTQAYPEAYKAASKHKIKLIYGVEAYLVEKDKRERPYHIVLLARNVEGLKNIYRLVSSSYIDHYYRHPKIPRELLAQNRSGILLGSACESGELYQAMLNGADRDQLIKIASFYDYLEVQPLPNNEFLLREGRVASRAELEDLVRRTVELGEILGKPVVATGDVHFVEPEHEIYRRIIQAGQGYEDAEAQAPLYLKTTGEMLAEFDFLEERQRRALVIENPNLITAMIEDIKPVPDGFYPPTIDRAEEEISRLTWDRAGVIYGSPLPELVEARIKRELDSIIRHGFSVLYLIAQKLVKKSNDDGYMVGSRGSVGSSLVAFLTGITEINPLPPHYICPSCKTAYFAEAGRVELGADLPDADCEKCGHPLNKDGFDIPFETFLGFEGDKVPDIDLNFSGDYQARAHQYVEELFGKENVFRAGTISTIAERTAYGFVVKFAESRQMQLKNSEINRLVRGIAGVRRTTGQHPGGLIVVPREQDIFSFTPLQHPADNKESGIITTHFDYHAIGDQLVKLDILGHDDPTVIKSLEDLTGVKASRVSLSDPTAMKLFSSVQPMGIRPEDIGSKVGTFGVPEFGTRFVRQILESTRPTTLSELVRICGLSHGTDVWLNNAQTLIERGTASLTEVICNRDDIMTYLIQRSMDKKQAFKIMENVRKGRGLDQNMSESMRGAGVPEWYIESCRKISYMFPKAHAAAYVNNSFRVAYFKVFYPLAFYASFFSIRAEDFEAETVLKGYDAIRARIKEIEKAGNEASQKDKKLLPILEVALEMCARGFHFWPVDIYKSEATRYVIKGQGLLLPFAALPNIGKAAAEGAVASRGDRPFISVEDFQARTRLNKTSIEILRQHNCFDGLPENNQIQLFA